MHTLYSMNVSANGQFADFMAPQSSDHNGLKIESFELQKKY